jgi:hypothetical protein
MPDGGYAGIGASEFARAFLPEIDLGLILIDGRSRISDSDLDLLAALESAKIASAALISRCDLLTAADTDRIVSATRDLAAKRLGWTPEVIPVSANASWVPRVSSWVEGKLAPQLREARAARLESTARAVQGLRASLTAALEMKLNHTGKRQDHSQEAEEIFQRMDECLHAFQQHWEKEFDKIAGWTGGILEEAAASLATAASPTDSSGGISSDLVSQTFVAILATQFKSFLAEYQDLTPRINADLHLLRSLEPSAILLEQALPAISSLPTPMRSQLTAVALPGTLARAGHAARIRHFRKELEDKAATRLRRTLEELQPRLRRWLLATMNTLRENMRMQTDPLRY